MRRMENSYRSGVYKGTSINFGSGVFHFLHEIAQVSPHPDEQEVLFSPKANFCILDQLPYTQGGFDFIVEKVTLDPEHQSKHDAPSQRVTARRSIVFTSVIRSQQSFEFRKKISKIGEYLSSGF
jgi:hypothetical protein